MARAERKAQRANRVARVTSLNRFYEPGQHFKAAISEANTATSRVTGPTHGRLGSSMKPRGTVRPDGTEANSRTNVRIINGEIKPKLPKRWGTK